MAFYYIFLAIAPAALWLWFFYRKDKWEPEPKMKVIKIFVLGFLATIPATAVIYLFKNKVYGVDDSIRALSVQLNIVVSFLVLAPVGEFFKYMVVKGFIYSDKEFNEPMDGVVYMVAAAMGYAAFENLVYILRIADPAEATVTAIVRGVLATPAHACFSAALGLYLGKAKFTKTAMQGAGTIMLGLLVATLLHGVFDTLTFLKPPYVYLSVVYLIVAWVVLMKKIKKTSDASPFRKQKSHGQLED